MKLSYVSLGNQVDTMLRQICIRECIQILTRFSFLYSQRYPTGNSFIHKPTPCCRNHRDQPCQFWWVMQEGFFDFFANINEPLNTTKKRKDTSHKKKVTSHMKKIISKTKKEVLNMIIVSIVVLFNFLFLTSPWHPHPSQPGIKNHIISTLIYNIFEF